MNLRIFDSSAALSAAAARTVFQQLEGKDSAAIGVSGGTSPRGLYTLLAQSPWREQLAATAITWVLVDERYVPEDDPQSNGAMIGRTLFSGGIAPSHRFLRFDTSFGDPSESAARFEREWREFQIEALDVAILGCGEDGHTASIFPGTPVLGVVDAVASAVFVPRLEQWRVTLTLPVIRAAAARMVIAPGASKAPILRDVRAGVEHPVALATSGVETWWFVDREAAALLDGP